MKIAVWHNLPSGGGKRLLFDHVQGLVGRGHFVEAWCPPSADREYLPLSSLVVEHEVDLSWPRSNRFTDKLGITLATARHLAAMDSHCRECADQIEHGDFDVLFANSCRFFRTTPIGRFVDIPSVMYLGEPFRSLYEASPRFRWSAPERRNRSIFHPSSAKDAIVDLRMIRNSRLQAREEVTNAAAFGRILVNSNFSRESVLRSYGLDSSVCYPGINIDRFVNQNLSRNTDLVGFGSITLEKNIRLCIEAVGLVSTPRPRLVWVGNIAHDHHLKEMQALALTRGVDFQPKIAISDAEVLDTLNRSMAMLYAPRLEPFGLAPLEGNACGLPIIAVAEGGVRETVFDLVNGLVVENDPAAMAAAIERLSSDPALVAQLRTNGRLAVEEKWHINGAIEQLEKQLARATVKLEGRG